MELYDGARAELSSLALKALDIIEEQYGFEAEVGDAVLLFEVRVPEGDETASYTHWVPTTDRPVVVQGLITSADKSLCPVDA